MKRPYVLTHTRGDQVLTCRHYARLNTSIPKATYILLTDGEPRDVIEIAHAEFGFQIATISVHVGGIIRIQLSKDMD